MKHIVNEEIVKIIEEVFENSTFKNNYNIEKLGNNLYKLTFGKTTVICGKPIVHKINKIK